MSMFQMIKGASIPDASKLREEYQVDEDTLSANVSAENIPRVFETFLNRMREDEPLFMFIEVPLKRDEELELNPQAEKEIREGKIEYLHKAVYYLDGFDRETMLGFLDSGIGELLINDGLVCFGFGSLDSNIELGKYKYNVLKGYFNGQDAICLTEIFDEFNIPCVPEIVTAWQLFTDERPGVCRKIEFDGRTVYDLIDQLKELGLYKAETRESD